MRIAILTVVVALAGAGTAGALSPPPNRPDPQITDGSLQRGLEAARKRWKTAHLGSYRYAVTMACFCPPNTGVFVVRRGVPTKFPTGEKRTATVPRLFKLIQQDIDRGVAGLSVRYGKRGVPKSIAIDGSKLIADDEVTYTISRFMPLK